MELTTQHKQILNEIIDLGLELEAIEYNRRFIGYEGFTSADLTKQRKSTRAKMMRRIEKLYKAGINVFDLTDYSYETPDGFEMELDYSLQFI